MTFNCEVTNMEEKGDHYHRSYCNMKYSRIFVRTELQKMTGCKLILLSFLLFFFFCFLHKKMLRPLIRNKAVLIWCHKNISKKMNRKHVRIYKTNKSLVLSFICIKIFCKSGVLKGHCFQSLQGAVCHVFQQKKNWLLG